MSSWHSYPKVYNLGHAAIRELLLDDVIVEEKVDGSQFSFGVFDGQLRVRSKGAVINLGAVPTMFQEAVAHVTALKPLLINGWTYRGEYLQKPKHNVLAYDRTPRQHIIIFDISPAEEEYLDPLAKRVEAERLGLEVVPVLYQGRVTSAEALRHLLERTSVLGGQKIEGFVIKNYARFGIDKKILIGKHVSEAFREVHRGDWKERNPGQTDILTRIIAQYKTPARWNKAIQHLRDDGKLEHSPKDIGALIIEAKDDLFKECAGEIRELLFQWAWPQIARGVVAGLAEHYKQHLLERQFASEDLARLVEAEIEKGPCLVAQKIEAMQAELADAMERR